MAGLNRSDLIKIKRFKESKIEFDRKVQLAMWLYLAAGLLLVAALVVNDAPGTAKGALFLLGLACLAPTLKPRAVGKIVGLVEKNYDTWMKQNKISGYSRKAGAFLLKTDNPEQSSLFHDPSCEECWHESEALFNLDENRMLKQNSADSGVRVPRQTVSQLDLLDYYWGQISITAALKLYASFGKTNPRAISDQSSL